MVTTIPRQFAPSPEDREAIAKRIAELRRCVAHCDIDQSCALVAQLQLQLASKTLTDEGAKALAKGFIAVVEDIPTFAVAEACRRWLRAETGKIGDGKDAYVPRFVFAPSPPELAMVARPIVFVATVQISQLKRLLEAKIVEDFPERPELAHLAGKAVSGLAASMKAPMTGYAVEADLPADGQHALRVQADLTARKERNAMREQTA